MRDKLTNISAQMNKKAVKIVAGEIEKLIDKLKRIS